MDADKEVSFCRKSHVNGKRQPLMWLPFRWRVLKSYYLYQFGYSVPLDFTQSMK